MTLKRGLSVKREREKKKRRRRRREKREKRTWKIEKANPGFASCPPIVFHEFAQHVQVCSFIFRRCSLLWVSLQVSVATSLLFVFAGSHMSAASVSKHPEQNLLRLLSSHNGPVVFEHTSADLCRSLVCFLIFPSVPL